MWRRRLRAIIFLCHVHAAYPFTEQREFAFKIIQLPLLTGNDSVKFFDGSILKSHQRFQAFNSFFHEIILS